MYRVGCIGLALLTAFAPAVLAQSYGEDFGNNPPAQTRIIESNLSDPDKLTQDARGNGKLDDHLNRANERDPSSATSHRERGDIWRLKREYEMAILDYTRALDASAGDADSYYGRAWSHHGTGDLGKAIEDYNGAVRLRSRWSDAYKMRAHARLAQGRLDLAMADFKRAIEYDPKDAYYLTALGLLRFYMGDYDVAVSNLSRSLQFKEDSSTMLLLYLARVRNGDKGGDELAANAKRLKAKQWPYPVVEFYLGIRTSAATLAAARNEDEKCQAHYYVGQWLLLRGSKAEALASISQAAQTCPKTFIEYGAATADMRRFRP